jgi:glutamyl-tRNA synthetase
VTQTLRVRLAPSLAGYLRMASARVAVLTWLLARHGGGRVVLRLDDIDPRDAAHAETAEYDLRWLCLDWDETWRQSERLARYADAADTLRRAGRLYPCFESEEELRAKHDFRVRHHRPAIYDRAMLKLTPAQRAAAEAGGKRPHWRFLLSAEPVAWNDLVLGRTEVKISAVSDPVLIRADGTPLPLLCAIVDDLDAGISHVVREADHVTGTALQLDIAAALGAAADPIRFGHVAPLGPPVDNLTLRRLRGDGFEPTAILSAFAAAAPRETFDLQRAARATFDMNALQAMNRVALRKLPFAEVAPRLPPGATEAFWLAVRDHLDLLSEARGWWDVVAGTIVPPVMEEGEFLHTALDLLPAEPWDGGVWTAWMSALAATTGRGGAALAAPLRLALTGEDHGPDLAALLPLIGRTRAAQRLRIAAE